MVFRVSVLSNIFFGVSLTIDNKVHCVIILVGEINTSLTKQEGSYHKKAQALYTFSNGLCFIGKYRIVVDIKY